MLNKITQWLREWDGNAVTIVCRDGKIQVWRSEGPVVEREYTEVAGQGASSALALFEADLAEELAAPTTPCNEPPETLRTGSEGLANV